MLGDLKPDTFTHLIYLIWFWFEETGWTLQGKQTTIRAVTCTVTEQQEAAERIKKHSSLMSLLCCFCNVLSYFVPYRLLQAWQWLWMVYHIRFGRKEYFHNYTFGCKWQAQWIIIVEMIFCCFIHIIWDFFFFLPELS